jgi:hypothetical protein
LIVYLERGGDLRFLLPLAAAKEKRTALRPSIASTGLTRALICQNNVLGHVGARTMSSQGAPRTPKRTADAALHMAASTQSFTSPGGLAFKPSVVVCNGSAALQLKVSLRGKPWEEVCNIMMLAAGDDSERLNAVIDLVDSSNSQGAKSIATMVDKIVGWGWIPATGQLESKELLTNTVCTDSLRYIHT